MFQLVPFLLRKEYGGGSYPSACPIMPVLGKGPEGQPAFPFPERRRKRIFVSAFKRSYDTSGKSLV